MPIHRRKGLRQPRSEEAPQPPTSDGHDLEPSNSGADLATPLQVDAHLAELLQRHELLQVVSSSIAELLTAGSLKESLPLAMKKIAAKVSIDRMLVVEVQRRAGVPPVNVPYYVWSTDTAPALQDPRSILAKDAAEHAALTEWRKPLQEGKSVFASQRTGPAALADYLARRNLSSLLLVPIIIHGKHWGQIGFDDCSNERDWTEDEISTLKLLADMIGVTITRERSMEELHARDVLLHAVTASIGEIMTAADLHAAISSSLATVARTLRADRMLVLEAAQTGAVPPLICRHSWLAVDAPPDREPIVLAATSNNTAEYVAWAAPLRLGQAITGTSRNASDGLKVYFSQLQLQSALIVPIMANGKFWGQIEFHACIVEREWTSAEVDILKTLAELIGTAIMRERYIEELANANRIIQNSPTILYRLRGEPSFPLMYVSQNVALLGYDPVELLSAPTLYHSYVHPEDRARVQTAMVELLAGNTQLLTLEFRMLNSSGESRWVENLYTPVRDGDGRLIEVEGIMTDITERKRAEQRLATGERLESIGRLAAGVAHEINTPIQYLNDSVSFIGDAVQDLLADNEMLRAAMPVPPPPDENIEELKRELPPALDRVADGLERIAEIVRSMKEFSHADQREKSQVDLNRAISSTLVIARSEYKYVADVETDFKELPLVTCHGGQINQVVLNLLVNAAHAIADTVKGTTNKGLITVKTYVEAGCAVVSISDTGGGIPDAIRKRIFEPFFTTKEVGKGTGQGLSIAHNVITSHGGTLDFVTDGTGTTFYVRLPVGAEDSEAAAA
jgi:PAS domain S-box-containing protein